MESKTKTCRFCGDHIPVLSGHCTQCRNQVYSVRSEMVTPSRRHCDYGALLISIPLISTLIGWLWVGATEILNVASARVVDLAVATILLTGAVAALEAQQWATGGEQKPGGFTPLGWFLLITLAWVVGFPLYLYRRKAMGLRNLLAVGAVPVIGFAMSYVVLVSSVGHQRGVPEASVYEQSFGVGNRIGS